jgi:hypothetical protein
VIQQETVINTSIVASSACFTKLNIDKKLTDEQFFEWLIGFIDAEYLLQSNHTLFKYFIKI